MNWVIGFKQDQIRKIMSSYAIKVLFSYFGVPVPSQKYKWLVLKLIENSADIVVEVLE